MQQLSFEAVLKSNEIVDQFIQKTFEIESFSIEAFNNSMKEMHSIESKVFQISKGGYYSLYRGCALPKILISRQINKNELLIHSVLKEKKIVIVIPDVNIDLLCNGKHLTPNELLIYTEGDEVHIQTPSNFFSWVLSISESDLVPYVGLEAINTIKMHSEAIRLGKYALLHLTTFKREVTRLAMYLINHQQHLSNVLLHDIQESFFLQISTLFSGGGSGNASLRASCRTQLSVVKRVLNYLDNNADIIVTIPQLAEHSFCSVRTLGYAFENILSTTPKAYLMNKRMHMIKMELKYHNPMQLKMVLEKHGVTNSSRFTQDFVKLFNIHPLEIMDKVKTI